MRIVDAETQLVKDILEEIQVVESRARKEFVIYVGHHPALGRVAIIDAKHGPGAIIELE